MKIAIDASRYEAKNPTGVEKYSFEIINALLKYFWQQKDHEILLYSPRDFHVHEGRSARYRKRIIPFRRMWSLVRLSWAMITERPDVLFVPSHVLPLVMPKKSVITIHDVAFRHFRRGYSVFQYLYMNWQVKRSVRKAAKIIVPSMAVKRDLVRLYGCKSGKVVVVHHGHDGGKVDVGDVAKIEEFFERYEFNPSEDDFMLFVGRLEHKKNVIRVMEAFRGFLENHPGWRLVMAGKPGVGFKKIQKKFFKLGLGDKIVMPGYVSDEEKAYLLEKCQFVVFPSLYEGFGFPVLEAFEAGKAVIVSEMEVFREVADQAGYYVNPKNVEEIRHGMLELAANEKMRKMLVGKGKDRLKRFSWERAGEETGKVLEELLESEMNIAEAKRKS